MIKYFELGADKRLNQVVVAGSHDAGITGGGANVQTQDKDIKGQAAAGVRVFDLRIAAAATGSTHGSAKGAQLKAFHGGVSKSTQTRFVQDVGRTVQVQGDSLKYGEYGMGLTKMLKDGKAFVTTHPEEFLIFKFDKCANWDLIAEACVSVLGTAIYKGAGNLNNKTLKDLKGKVIVVFTSDGIAAVRTQGYPVGSGILGIKNLYGGGAVYEEDYDGMQYFGKGGTSVAKPFGKLRQNEKKQTKLMTQGADGNPDVLGMMYWTSTGLIESIRERNAEMWTGSNVTALKKMWKNGLSESIESRIAKNVDPTSHASGGTLKAFMPNIVMIDFADETKCQTIYELNAVAASALTRASIALDKEVEDLKAKYADLQRNMRRMAQQG